MTGNTPTTLYSSRPLRQTGLTLIEIMVAMVISLVLLGGVLQIFQSNKQSFRVQEALSRVQENGRTAMRILTEDLRMADFWGCTSQDISVTDNLNSGGSGYVNLLDDGGLAGTDNTGLNSSDTITLEGAMSTGLTIQPPYGPSESANLGVAAGNSLQQGDILLVTDCHQGDIFQVSNANPSSGSVVHNTGSSTVPGNYNPSACGGGGNAHCLSQVYQGDATVYQARQTTYSIAAGESGEPALFRQINSNAATELVEGVEDMQILYGERLNSNTGTMRYVAAGTAGLNMNNVASVRITLTLRSIATNVATSGDGRLRRTYTTTISIRNRNP